jgi:phytoene dehydrogenase-like protein
LVRDKKVAAVIGSGPNGLAAAIALAQAGLEVTVYEKHEVIGGGCRSLELIQKGYIHDICSTVHLQVKLSPFFQKLKLEEFGLRWVTPPLALANPFDDGTAAVVSQTMSETLATLDSIDEKAYAGLMSRLVNHSQELMDEIMRFPSIPLHHPFLMLNFGIRALTPTTKLARNLFKGKRARALIAGMGAHSGMELEQRGSFASGFLMGITAHSDGWPFPEGGSQKTIDALAGCLTKLGSMIVTGYEVKSIEQLPPHDLVLLDVTPRQLLSMAEKQLPSSYINKLKRYKYGCGAFKCDWVLDGPIPWQASECCKANTVHIGGYLEEIETAEREVNQQKHSEKPFVILTQPSLFDHTRASGDKQIAYAYCHVPNGSTFNMTERIEAQIERFAPGFRDRIIGRHTMSTADLERHNPNCVGGDFLGGAQSLQKLILPPVSYETPIKNVFLCSSSTPPSPGVHGMCGFRAAQTAIRKLGISRNGYTIKSSSTL